MTGWLQITEAPCRFCAVWTGPHEHSVMPDGRLGVVVRRIPEPDEIPEQDEGSVAQIEDEWRP